MDVFFLFKADILLKRLGVNIILWYNIYVACKHFICKGVYP